MISAAAIKLAIGRVQQHRRGWAGDSDNRKILFAALIVGLLTLLAKVGGMARELVTAASFGTSDAVDAFVLAWELPAFAINVIASSFNAAFIPAYIQTRDQDGPNAARQVLSGVLIMSLGLLLGTALLLAIIGPIVLPVVASGFGPEKLELTRHLLYILLPSVVLSGLATLLTGVLSAGERFALGSASALAVPLCTIAVLLLGRDAWGISALAIGLVTRIRAATRCCLSGARNGLGLTLSMGDGEARLPVVRRIHRPIHAHGRRYAPYR